MFGNDRKDNRMVFGSRGVDSRTHTNHYMKHCSKHNLDYRATNCPKCANERKPWQW